MRLRLLAGVLIGALVAAASLAAGPAVSTVDQDQLLSELFQTKAKLGKVLMDQTADQKSSDFLFATIAGEVYQNVQKTTPSLIELKKSFDVKINPELAKKGVSKSGRDEVKSLVTKWAELERQIRAARPQQ